MHTHQPSAAYALRALICSVSFATASVPAALAHGGAYRGPNLPPPALGTPGKGQANTGGPSTTGGGVKHTDPAAWSQWWALARDEYIPRTERVFDGRGSTGEDESGIGAGRRAPLELLQEVVVPAVMLGLKKKRTDDVDIVTASLMTLAKIGQTAEPGESPDLVEVIAAYLDDDDQEIAETAVVALGVLGDRGGAPFLAEILHGSRSGANLVGERKVPQRRRAYAAYGLAVIGSRPDDESVRTFAAHNLIAELRERRPASLDISVACVLGLGLVPLELSELPEDGVVPSPGGSREGQVLYLLSLLDERRFDDVVKSNVPVAVARLVQDAYPELKALATTRLVPLIAARAKVDEGLRAGAIQALGMIADDDMDPLDVKVRADLMATAKAGNRLQRNLALAALGRIGGRAGEGLRTDVPNQLRNYLMERVSKGQSAEKPWAALAVGLLEHGRLGQGGAPALGTRTALRFTLESVGNPSFAGALAVALGLCGDPEAAPLLIARMEKGDQTIRGHAATGLGLMRAREAIEPLRKQAGGGPPGIAREAAIALALCGDKEAWRHLDASDQYTTALMQSISDLLSLAYVGDSRAVIPLVETALDSEGIVRAYAVVALGIICDKDLEPWNHALAQSTGWWSAPPTLLDPKRGLGVVVDAGAPRPSASRLTRTRSRASGHLTRPSTCAASPGAVPLPAPRLPVTRTLNVGFVVVDGVHNTELSAPLDIFHHTVFHAEPGMRDVRFAGARAGYVVSLCDGSFVLARAGLLDRLEVTTFPGDRDRMQAMFSDLLVHHDHDFVHDGKAITSVGGALSFDPALYLCELLYGDRAAQGIARGVATTWDRERANGRIVR